jgi:CheY-like chemotaxis protein
MAPFLSTPSLEPVHAFSEIGSGRRPVILVVEDEEVLLHVIESLLAFAGFDVIGACSEEEAVSAAAQCNGHIDLLVSDVVLKSGTGPGLARRIRDGRPDLQVMFLSGYPREQCANYGEIEKRDAFIMKPLEGRIFLKIVAEAAKKGQA